MESGRASSFLQGKKVGCLKCVRGEVTWLLDGGVEEEMGGEEDWGVLRAPPRATPPGCCAETETEAVARKGGGAGCWVVAGLRASGQ